LGDGGHGIVTAWATGIDGEGRALAW
jgi:hypothetical protein